MNKKEYGINNPKPKILQLFCKHKYCYCTRLTQYFNLSGETHYKVCEKCGKVASKTFVKDD
jgi:hypothetical protein